MLNTAYLTQQRIITIYHKQ